MKENIEALASRLADAVPDGVRSVRGEVEQNFAAILRAGLGRLELVTREDFDVQAAVLARTRAKLEALEARVRELEARGSDSPQE